MLFTTRTVPAFALTTMKRPPAGSSFTTVLLTKYSSFKGCFKPSAPYATMVRLSLAALAG